MKQNLSLYRVLTNELKTDTFSEAGSDTGWLRGTWSGSVWYVAEGERPSKLGLADTGGRGEYGLDQPGGSMPGGIGPDGWVPERSWWGCTGKGAGGRT